MTTIMPQKRIFPPNNPPQEKTSVLSNARPIESLNTNEINSIERKGLRVRKGVVKGENREKGCVIFAYLKCYSCRASNRVSFYSDATPPYVRCQGCDQIYPFDSYYCWAWSSEAI